jgi:hypothetical protein
VKVGCAGPSGLNSGRAALSSADSGINASQMHATELKSVDGTHPDDQAAETAQPQPVKGYPYLEGIVADRDELRAVLRAILIDGGDIVDMALAARRRGWGQHSVQAAAALREEFGVSIMEALDFAAWVEVDTDTDESRAVLRARITNFPSAP